MARSYARFTTAGLTDPDWMALPPAPQWLYMVILRQPRLTMWGTTDVLLRRWATTAATVTAEDLAVWLNVLEVTRFVHVDHATDEVAVRTFTRHDLSPKNLSGPVVKGMWSAWEAIASASIRAFVVCAVPDPAWAKLAPAAPAAAVDIRRSASFEWERVSPLGWEGRSSFECPASCLLPPATPVIVDPETHAVGVESVETMAPEADRAERSEITDPVALDGEALEQEARRALRLYGARRSQRPGVLDPDGYAAQVRREARTDGTFDRLRELVAAGASAEAAVDAIAAPAVVGPVVDDVAAARDRAGRREAETLAAIEADRAEAPAIRRPGAAAAARAALQGAS